MSSVGKIGSGIAKKNSTGDFMRMSLQKRSLVRLIGSQLPLPNAQRPRFEALPNGSNVVCEEQQKKSLFSLSDIAQILDIPEMIGTLPVRGVRHSMSSPDLTLHETVQAGNGLGSSRVNDPAPAVNDDGVNTKISALEDELAQLRMQIAMLVSNQQNAANNASLNESTLSNGAPQITSTPIKQAPVPPPPPPPTPMGLPPPPPPPPMGPPQNNTQQLSVHELIKQRKLSKSKSCLELSPSAKKHHPSLPAMTDILKDMHKVKLRSVTRSPNGTPINEKRCETVGTDPASLIAAALKKKFAHRQNFKDSPDKNNDSGDAFSLKHVTPSKSITDSPEIPKFGQHMLKKRGTRKSTSSSLFKTERKNTECVS